MKGWMDAQLLTGGPKVSTLPEYSKNINEHDLNHKKLNNRLNITLPNRMFFKNNDCCLDYFILIAQLTFSLHIISWFVYFKTVVNSQLLFYVCKRINSKNLHLEGKDPFDP